MHHLHLENCSHPLTSLPLFQPWTRLPLVHVTAIIVIFLWKNNRINKYFCFPSIAFRYTQVFVFLKISSWASFPFSLFSLIAFTDKHLRRVVYIYSWVLHSSCSFLFVNEWMTGFTFLPHSVVAVSIYTTVISWRVAFLGTPDFWIMSISLVFHTRPSYSSTCQSS